MNRTIFDRAINYEDRYHDDAREYAYLTVDSHQWSVRDVIVWSGAGGRTKSNH